MKILLDHPLPFQLAHGGLQIQIEQTKAALEKAGLEVEYVRWWDEHQKGNIIHYFGRPTSDYIKLCHQKGIKLVLAELLTGLGSRSAGSRSAQKLAMETAKKVVPGTLLTRLAWDSYMLADACVALTPWEAQLMKEMFNAPPGRMYVIPNGVEDIFLQPHTEPRGKWLVCTATITERKRVLEVAEAAVQAQTPVWIIGKPYSETDNYAMHFKGISGKCPQLIRYEGPVSDRAKLAQIYSQARGFVLLSSMESLSLSALEAAACGCPLLLSDLPWARSVFNEKATYCPVSKSIDNTAKVLRQFYDNAPNLPIPAKPLSWSDVAQQLRKLYEELLSTSW